MYSITVGTTKNSINVDYKLKNFIQKFNEGFYN